MCSYDLETIKKEFKEGRLSIKVSYDFDSRKIEGFASNYMGFDIAKFIYATKYSTNYMAEYGYFYIYMSGSVYVSTPTTSKMVFQRSAPGDCKTEHFLPIELIADLMNKDGEDIKEEEIDEILCGPY